MVDAYLGRFAERAGTRVAPLDDDGHTTIVRGSARLGVQVLEERGVLLLVAKIMPLPPARREELLLHLLELSFLRTSDAAFAVDGHDVYVRALRRLSGLDYEELEDLADTVASVADRYDDLLRKEYA
jgi:hypothetical protein